MLSLHEFNALSNFEKSEYLRKNYPVNARARALRSPVHGVGTNDANYLTGIAIDGKLVRCPAYKAWAHMIGRAYDPKCHVKQPTYVGVKVCIEWLSFMAFRKWWIVNQVDGWQLDKDLIGDSRKYSPESCIFVPSWLNNFTTDRSCARGDFPIGVHWRKDSGKYQAYCNHPFGRKEHLGYFPCAYGAHAAWKSRKLEISAELKPRMDEIDARIYPRVVHIIENAK